MNCLADKISSQTTHTTVHGSLTILLIFLVFSSALGGFQSANAQDQWRVFTTVNSPLPSNLVGSIVIDSNNIKWIGTENGMVKIEGNNWTIYDTSNTPLGANAIFPRIVDKLNNIWITVRTSTADFKGIAKYDGFNWTIFDTTNSGIPSNTVNNVAVDDNNTKWICTNKGLAKFNDSTWIIYNSTNSGLPVNTTYTAAIESNIKWIGMMAPNGGVAKFNDTGWVIYNTGNSGLPMNYVTTINIDNWGIKWIGTYYGGGIARFNSITNNWIVYNTQNSGLPDGYILSILFQGNIKWIGTVGGGLARFNDTNWIVFNPENSPLLDYAVHGLGLDSNGNLWIGGGGLVIYNSNGIVGIKKESTTSPIDFALYQNYPNPFNPVTRIRYDVPANVKGKKVKVKLIVYDVVGEEIKTLVNENQGPGIYEVTWDGSWYASGVYFYRLESGSFVETKKMVLVK